MTTLPLTLSKSYAVGLPSPLQKSRKSYAVNFDPPPQPTKIIRSVSDPLPRYDFSVKKYKFYY